MNDVTQLRGFPRKGEGQDDIARRDHAKVAVAGLGRMQEKGGRAGGGQGGGDLTRHVAALADAGDHHTAGRLRDQAGGGLERPSQPIRQRGGQGAQALDLRVHRPGGGGGAIDRVRIILRPWQWRVSGAVNQGSGNLWRAGPCRKRRNCPAHGAKQSDTGIVSRKAAHDLKERAP